MSLQQHWQQPRRHARRCVATTIQIRSFSLRGQHCELGVITVCDGRKPSRAPQNLKDMRENNWVARREVEGPKKITDVHEDAKREVSACRCGTQS